MAELENKDDKANIENKIPENESGEQKLKREHPRYYAFVKENLPKVKKVMAIAKSRVLEMRSKIQETKAVFKKAIEAAIAKRSFSAKVYCIKALEGIKSSAKIGVKAVGANYQNLKSALVSGSKTVNMAIVAYIKAELPSGMLVVKPRNKPKDKDKNKQDKKKAGEVEKDAKAKKKTVAKAVSGAELNQQKDRVIVSSVDNKQREQAMRLGNALQQQQKSSLEQEANLAIEKMLKIKTERAQRDELLVKEQANRKITMEKNNEIQANQQRQMDALIKENKAQNIEVNLPKQEKKNVNQKFDWSKNNSVIETKAKEAVLKKESAKVVEETKKAINNSKKEVLNRLKELSGRNGNVGALKNDFVKAGVSIDISNMKPEYKVKIEQAQEQVREQTVAKEFATNTEKGFELRPSYATEEFKKAWEEKDNQEQNAQSNEKQEIKEEKPLSKAETMTLMRNGVNPKLDVQKNKTKEPRHSGKTIDMKMQRYLNGGKQVG